MEEERKVVVLHFKHTRKGNEEKKWFGEVENKIIILSSHEEQEWYWGKGNWEVGYIVSIELGYAYSRILKKWEKSILRLETDSISFHMRG